MTNKFNNWEDNFKNKHPEITGYYTEYSASYKILQFIEEKYGGVCKVFEFINKGELVVKDKNSKEVKIFLKGSDGLYAKAGVRNEFITKGQPN